MFVAKIEFDTRIKLFLRNIMPFKKVFIICSRLARQLTIVIIRSYGGIALKEIRFIQNIDHHILTEYALWNILFTTRKHRHQQRKRQKEF